jgi:hypothetical protein
MTPCSLVEILVGIYQCPFEHISGSLHTLHPRKQQSSGKIMVLCVLIFALFNGGWKDKRLLMQTFLKFNLLLMLYKCHFDWLLYAECDKVRWSAFKYIFQRSRHCKSIE